MRRLLPALALALALAGCGGGEDADDAAGPQSTDASAPASSGASCVPSAPTAAVAPGAAVDMQSEPKVEIPDTPPPCGLVVSDLRVGSGPAAKPGDQVAMRYVGVTYSDGKKFDASWDRGKDDTFPLTLGGGQVIAGWDQGIVGMKAGGRRQLIIPPALAYGAEGRPPLIPPSATLVFVVDLVKIG